MHRINDSVFTEGSPNGVPPSIVTAKWLNAVQEEICGLIESVGLTVNKEDSDGKENPPGGQLKEAIAQMVPLHIITVPMSFIKSSEGNGEMNAHITIDELPLRDLRLYYVVEYEISRSDTDWVYFAKGTGCIWKRTADTDWQGSFTQTEHTGNEDGSVALVVKSNQLKYVSKHKDSGKHKGQIVLKITTKKW